MGPPVPPRPQTPILFGGRGVRFCFVPPLPPLAGRVWGGVGGSSSWGCFLGSSPPTPPPVPGAEEAMGGGGCCQVGGRRGLDISCDTERRERFCTPFPPAGEGLRGSAAGCPPFPPTPAALGAGASSSLPRLRARRGGGGRRQLQAGAWPGAARPRSPRAALSDRPGNRGPIPPAAGHGAAPRGLGPRGAAAPRSRRAAGPRVPLRGGRALRGGGETAASPGGAAPAAPALGADRPRSAASIAGRGRGASRPGPWRGWGVGGGGPEGAAPLPLPSGGPGLPTAPSPGAGLRRGGPVPCRAGQRPPGELQSSLASGRGSFVESGLPACKRVMAQLPAKAWRRGERVSVLLGHPLVGCK